MSSLNMSIFDERVNNVHYADDKELMSLLKHELNNLMNDETFTSFMYLIRYINRVSDPLVRANAYNLDNDEFILLSNSKFDDFFVDDSLIASNLEILATEIVDNISNEVICYDVFSNKIITFKPVYGVNYEEVVRIIDEMSVQEMNEMHEIMNEMNNNNETNEEE